MLIVVMPVCNEAANLESVATDWMACFKKLQLDFQFLALNDGSTDATPRALDSLAERFAPHFRAVHQANSGHGRTCRVGYEIALGEEANWILQIDSNGQCDPAYFAEFWSARRGHDCVFGYRRTRDNGWGRVLVSLGCRGLLWAMTGHNVRDANVPYRLMRADALRAALALVPADFELQNVALTHALRLQRNLRWKHLPIHFRARQGGANSIKFKNIFRMGWKMIWDLSRVRSHSRQEVELDSARLSRRPATSGSA